MNLLQGQQRRGVEYLQHVGDLLLALDRVLAGERSRIPGGEGDGAIRLCPAPWGQRLVKSATVHSVRPRMFGRALRTSRGHPPC
eukprot:8823036-Pyramimonas_sp.AAC.1